MARFEETESRQIERRLERSVWSQPALISDMVERRIAARIGCDKMLAAILRVGEG